MATKITMNFTFEEFINSSTAKAKGIDNTPSLYIKKRITEETAPILQRLREWWGSGISISSGYRCEALNKAVGGASNSMHKQGYAVDINPTNGKKAEFKKAVLEWAKSHAFDQIILEQCDANGVPSWIHLGVKHTTHGQRKQILTAKKVNGKWAYSTYKGLHN